MQKPDKSTTMCQCGWGIKDSIIVPSACDRTCFASPKGHFASFGARLCQRMCPSGMSAPGKSDVKRLKAKVIDSLINGCWLPWNTPVAHSLNLFHRFWLPSMHSCRAGIPLSGATKEAKRSFFVAIVRKKKIANSLFYLFSLCFQERSLLTVFHYKAIFISSWAVHHNKALYNSTYLCFHHESRLYVLFNQLSSRQVYLSAL